MKPKRIQKENFTWKNVYTKVIPGTHNIGSLHCDATTCNLNERKVSTQCCGLLVVLSGENDVQVHELDISPIFLIQKESVAPSILVIQNMK